MTANLNPKSQIQNAKVPPNVLARADKVIK
jgi:hypothetical protein